MIIRLVASSLILIGASGFFMPLWIGFAIRHLGAQEMPLSLIEDIAVSNDNHLYLALMFTSRVQKYSSDGKFVSSFGVNSVGGIFCIDAGSDRLTINFGRRDATDEFELDGRPTRLNMPTDKTRPRGINRYGDCAIDSQIRSLDWSLHAVSVMLVDNRPAVTIKRQAWHYVALHPFASWLIGGVGLFLFPEWRRAVLRSTRTTRQ